MTLADVIYPHRQYACPCFDKSCCKGGGSKKVREGTCTHELCVLWEGLIAILKRLARLENERDFELMGSKELELVWPELLPEERQVIQMARLLAP